MLPKLKIYGVDADHFRTIVPASVVSLLKTRSNSFGIGGSETGTIIYVGRLPEEKGVGILVRSMKEVVRLRRAAKLVIVGDGALRSSLQTFVRKEKLSQHVLMVGSVA